MQPAPAPLIGIVAEQLQVSSVNPHTPRRAFTGAYDSYLHCLRSAGALPVIVPLGLAESSLHDLFDRLDGVLLAGGGDLAPEAYGQTPPHPAVREVNPARDEAELNITRWAAAADVPLLGICRGHQVVNVALGGTLIMDIPTQVKTTINHHTGRTKPLGAVAHNVTISPDSHLAAILNTTEIGTNSRHHQAIDRPAEGLRITAHAPDGVIEAAEHPDRHFLLAVQWHPENMCADDPAMQALFTAFVRAAAQHRLEAAK